MSQQPSILSDIQHHCGQFHFPSHGTMMDCTITVVSIAVKRLNLKTKLWVQLSLNKLRPEHCLLNLFEFVIHRCRTRWSGRNKKSLFLCVDQLECEHTDFLMRHTPRRANIKLYYALWWETLGGFENILHNKWWLHLYIYFFLIYDCTAIGRRGRRH